MGESEVGVWSGGLEMLSMPVGGTVSGKELPMVKLVSAAVPGRSLARLYGLMGLMNFLFLVLTLPLPSILTLYWSKGRTSTMVPDLSYFST